MHHRPPGHQREVGALAHHVGAAEGEDTAPDPAEAEEMRLSRTAESARMGTIQTLKRDPVTGAYRPG